MHENDSLKNDVNALQEENYALHRELERMETSRTEQAEENEALQAENVRLAEIGTEVRLKFKKVKHEIKVFKHENKMFKHENKMLRKAAVRALACSCTRLLLF